MKIRNGVLVEINNNDIDCDGCCVVPYGVTSIGLGTFEKSNVKSVIISNSVTDILENAFRNCINLTSVTMPSSLIQIGPSAFEGCDFLKEVHITDVDKWCGIDFCNAGSNPLLFARNLYLNKELITELSISDDVTRIKNHAFMCCNSIKSIKIGDNLTNIGLEAFCGCKALTHVTIPNNVKTIEDFAFHGCVSLESIVIPENVTTIKGMAFAYCHSLSKIVIKSEPSFIGNDIFYSCENLKKIHVQSEKVKQRLKDAKNIYIPKGCEIIVDKTLNKNVTLGTDYLLDTSIESSSNKDFKSDTKNPKEKDGYSRGDEL